MTPVFTAAQFTATPYHTAADKAKFANHFVRFVQSGFKRTLFPKWFYRRLSMTFGHIAHFDIHGFYATWFTTPHDQLAFLKRVAEWQGYGDPAYTYADVEDVLREWVRYRSTVTDDLIEQIRDRTQRAELAELARLKAKYPGHA